MPDFGTGHQLALDIKLNEDATLANFCILPGLDEVASAIKENIHIPNHQYLWIHGSSCSGRSHLLQAACEQVKGRAQYLPLSQLIFYPAAAVLDELGELELLALDDMHCVAGNVEWEGAVFRTFNQAQNTGCRMIFSANHPASEIEFKLPDLKSRMTWSVIYKLPYLDDQDKATILSFRASRLGLNLADEVAKFIVRRADRNLARLIELLHKFDEASLKERRSLTIPFIKEILGW